MLRLLALTILLLAAPRLAAAADKFPSVITGEAELGEGDLAKTRQDARDAGLRQAVLDAVRAEIGQAAIDDNALLVRARLVNAFADFILESGIQSESKSGGRLKVVVGYELDRDKLRARIAALRLQAAERRARVLLLWGEEEKAVKTEDALGEGGAEAAYRASAWTEGVTSPADVRAVAGALAANGLEVAELGAADRAWARGELAGREVTKQFLRDAAARASADSAVFLRIVHRRLAGPPAAHMHFLRVHHVAFVYDAAKGDFAGPPVAVPVVDVEGAAGGTSPVPDEWVNRLLTQLVVDSAPGARLVVKGVGSAARFDGVWAALRKIDELGAVVPRELSASAVVFEFSRPVGDDARAALEKALAGEWSNEGGVLTLTLPKPEAAPAAKPKKK